MRAVGFLWVALASCGALGCSSEDDKKTGAGGAFDSTNVDAAMQGFLSQKSLRGASLVLVQKDRGQIYSKGYGSFAVDRTYLIMSSSKILTVGVLMRLAEQGVVDMNAPIGNYVSAWGPGKSSLTLTELVSNSSGLPGIVDHLVYAPYQCMLSATDTLTNCAKAIYTTTADAADVIPPKTGFHYGGGQWQLAGGVAEVASGKSWATLLTETYGPCGVPSLGYTNAISLSSLTLGPDGGLSTGGVGYPKTFDGDPTTLPSTQNPSMEGGAFVNVLDYAKILLAHLQGGKCGAAQVLSPASVTAMQKDRVAEYGGSTEQQMRLIMQGVDPTALTASLDFAGYGTGWWVDRTHPGVFVDPGAYGSDAWLDLPRNYAGFIAIEGNVLDGAEMLTAVKPAVDAAIDATGW